MVGKVHEIQSLTTEDGLAKQIAIDYSNWCLQRATKIAEIKELRNYLFATDTRSTTDSEKNWKNSTTIPKLTQIRDNLHANYKAALFANPNWLTWEGNDAASVESKKSKAILAYMKNKLRQSDFESVVDNLLYDYIDNGNCFGEVQFIKEEKTDAETGERIPGYIGPKLVRNSIFDHVFNPVTPSYKDSPKITRYLKTIGELKLDLQENPSIGYSAEALSKAENYRTALTQYKESDINKAEGYTVDGFGSMSEYYKSGYAEILVFRGNIHDKDGVFYKDKIISVLDRKYLLKIEDNPSWLGESSQVHVGWRHRPDNLYDMGPLDNLVGLQYRLDHLENLKADALDQTIHPPKIVKGDVPAFEWGPDVTVHIPDSDGSIEVMPPNAAAFQVSNEIQFLMALMEAMAGAPSEAMGIRTPGEKTMYEVQQLQNAASRLFQDKISKFEREFLEPVLNLMFEVSRRHLDGADIVRVMDDDIGVQEFISVTKEDITAKGKLQPKGSSHFAAKAQLIQNFTGIFNSPVGSLITPHLSKKKLSFLVEEFLGVERFGLFAENIGITEDAETQRIINQAKETLEAESITPTEDEFES